MYHIELRQFPNNAWRFNLSEADMRAVAEPWARGEIVDIGERKWNPHTATLTILEGPELELQELSMGRGWRTAQRKSDDVTQRLLGHYAQVAASVAAVLPPSAPKAGAPSDALSLGVQIAALLGPDPVALLEAWRSAASAGGLRPSESLAQAERALDAP